MAFFNSVSNRSLVSLRKLGRLVENIFIKSLSTGDRHVCFKFMDNWILRLFLGVDKKTLVSIIVEKCS